MDQDKVLELRERLSGLADGELDGETAARLLAAPGAQVDELRASWRSYHLIGEVLRGDEQAALHASSGFLERLQVRLAAEPPLVAERPSVAEAPQVGTVQRRVEPANDASFRWKMVAGCASFAAVAALAWNIVGVGPSAAPGSQLAAMPAPAPVVVAANPPVPAAAPQQVQLPVVLPDGAAQVMIRDARLDELLSAHRQTGGSSALQMPMAAGFVRSATFAAPER